MTSEDIATMDATTALTAIVRATAIVGHNYNDWIRALDELHDEGYQYEGALGTYANDGVGSTLGKTLYDKMLSEPPFEEQLRPHAEALLRTRGADGLAMRTAPVFVVRYTTCEAVEHASHLNTLADKIMGHRCYYSGCTILSVERQLTTSDTWSGPTVVRIVKHELDDAGKPAKGKKATILYDAAAGSREEALEMVAMAKTIHGHDLGPAIEIQIAQRVSVSWRTEQRVRIGGEEYAILNDVTR